MPTFNNKKISCVLIDLDNTLIGIPNIGNYIQLILNTLLSTIFNLEPRSKIEMQELFHSGKDYLKVLTKWGIHDGKRFWTEFDKIDFKNRELLFKNNSLILYNDVLDSLKALKKMDLVLGVVSNSANHVANWEVSAYDLQYYFDTIRGLGDKQEFCKPEPDGILNVLKTLKKSPDETLYVGDSSVDIQASLRAGITPIWINRDENYQNIQIRENVIYSIKNILTKYNKKMEEDLTIIKDLTELVTLMKEDN